MFGQLFFQVIDFPCWRILRTHVNCVNERQKSRWPSRKVRHCIRTFHTERKSPCSIGPHKIQVKFISWLFCLCASRVSSAFHLSRGYVHFILTIALITLWSNKSWRELCVAWPHSVAWQIHSSNFFKRRRRPAYLKEAFPFTSLSFSFPSLLSIWHLKYRNWIQCMMLF